MRNFFKQIDNHFFCLFFSMQYLLLWGCLINYADGNPAPAFTDQQNKYSLTTVIGDRLEAKGEGLKANEILFVNIGFNDLVIDVAKAESQLKDKKSKAQSQKLLLVKLNKGWLSREWAGKFKVESKDVYEVWVKNNKGLEDRGWGLEDKVLRFEVGREEFGFGGETVETNDKWIKVGDVELAKGKHKVSVRSQNKKKLKKLFQEMEIVVVSKKKLEEYRKIVAQRPIGYLFYIDKENVEDMLKDEEKLRDIKLNGDNPFRIGKREFYIPEDGSYSLKAFVKPKRDFLESRFVSSSSSSSSSSSASLGAVSGWDIKALNTIYKQDISKDGMRIDAYFQGKGDVKESIVLTRGFSGVSIKDRPYLALSVELEEGPDVQEMDVNIRFTNPNSLVPKTTKLNFEADNKLYVVNLYEMAKSKWQMSGGDIEDLVVDEVILEFNKRYGIDLSGDRGKKIYTFLFKNIAFLKSPRPILAEFRVKDDLTAYLPDCYYYFDSNGDLKRVDFPEQVPWYIKDVYRLHLNRFIDLKEIPVLLLSFAKPELVGSQQSEFRSFPYAWRVVLGLDFDGDEKEDDKIETFVPVAGLVDGKLLLTVPAYEEVKKQLAVSSQQSAVSKKHYNLLFIGTSHPEDKEVLYQTVMSKKLVRYREHVYELSDLKDDTDVLEVDGERYNLAKGKDSQQFGSQRSAVENHWDGNWIEFSDIYLKKGEHALTVLENKEFKVEMVEVKPEARS